jgi:two-component system, NarL family, response regulator YdfI
VIRVFLIAAPGRAGEKLEELLDSAEPAIIGRAGQIEAVDDELADQADVLVVDAAAAPIEDVLESLQQARLLRSTKVVLVGDPLPSASVNRAIRSGVRGILPQSLAPEQLSAALEAVVHGLVVIHPNAMQRAQPVTDDFVASVEALTARERDVLQMLSQGFGNKEIAALLKISDHTVKFHIASIFGKLGASTRTEAVSIAMRQGLILF